MAKFYNAKISQTSGEVTQKLGARSDLAAYKNGAKEIKNFLPLPQGGITNRPGTHFLADSIVDGCRIVPFVVNSDISYVLCFYPGGVIRVFTKNGLVATVSGSHPYTAAQLKEMRYLQSVDIMFLFNQNHQPRQIRRVGNSWSLLTVTFKGGPYQEVNTNVNTLVTFTPDGNQGVNQTGLLTASSGIFSPTNVGQLFYLEFYVDAESGVFTPVASTVNVCETIDGLFGGISMESELSWTGTISLKRQGPTDLQYETVSSMSASGGSPFPSWGYSGNEDEVGTVYDICFTGTIAPKIRYSSSGGIAFYPFIITQYIDSRNVRVRLDKDVSVTFIGLISGSSASWAFGAFGGSSGWPALGIFHQERLVLANTIAEPTSIWMSKPANWLDFGTTIPTEDTDSITLILASKQINEVRALSSREDLLIFTAGAEFIARTGSQADVFTPSSIVVVPSGYRGSFDLDCLDIGISTLFVQRHGNVVRGLGYKLESDSYDTTEISVLSEHLFEGRQVVRWAYQQDPWSIVWIVLDNGEVLTLTLLQEHQVTAWAHQVFNAPIKDVCVIPGAAQDEVFFIADTHLVYMETRYDGDDFVADSYLDEDTPYVSSYESLELEEEQAQGTLQGRIKHSANLTLRVLRTCGLKAGIITENNNKVDVAQIPYNFESEYVDIPYTGDIYMWPAGDMGRHNRVRIENAEATPITILGFWREVAMEDDQ